MRVLVTGANGFVGKHLLDEITSSGHEPLLHVFGHGAEEIPNAVCGDLRNAGFATSLVSSLAPDACIHLAGMAFVPLGWENPALMYEVNLIGTVNMLEAIRACRPDIPTLIVSTSHVYGDGTGDQPITELDPPRPSSIYAVSKLAAETTGMLYARKYAMRVMSVRPHNHIGPGQSANFVAASFARQLIDIRNGAQEPVMMVGNLESERDFADVRDVVRAYRLLLERGRPGGTYNIASGAMVRVGDLLEQLCEIVGVRPDIRVDPDRFRPTDRQAVLDTSRIRGETGWKPIIPLRKTLLDIVNHLLA